MDILSSAQFARSDQSSAKQRIPLILILQSLFAFGSVPGGQAMFYGPVFGCGDCTQQTLTSSGSLTREAVTRAAVIRRMTMEASRPSFPMVRQSERVTLDHENQLMEETSDTGTCVEGSTFGFIGAEAWVDEGCTGLFRFCYTEGRTERVTCSSMNGRPESCQLNQPCDLESVALVEAPSNSPCVDGYSYRVDRTRITVTKGCRATFMIGCRACTRGF